MIQRIQSVYLLIAAVASFLIFAFPLGEIMVQGAEFQFDVFGLEKITSETTETVFNTYLLVALSAIAGLISLADIFLFKNRKLQVKVAQGNMILNTLLLVGIFYFTDQATKTDGNSAMMHYQVGIVMPIIALIFLILANRSINKDEELVRSADRLR